MLPRRVFQHTIDNMNATIHTKALTLTPTLTLTLKPNQAFTPTPRFDRCLRYLARGPIFEAEALTEDPWTGCPVLTPMPNPNRNIHPLSHL